MQLGITEYSLGQVTLEQLFIELVRKQHMEQEEILSEISIRTSDISNLSPNADWNPI